MQRTVLIIVFGVLSFIPAIKAQNIKRDDSRLKIHYLLKADTADLSGYDVEIHLRHAPHHFQLAMASHHEYDDRFWRFVRSFRVKTHTGNAVIIKKDSALWDITIPGNSADIYYRIKLPVTPRFAHRPFLSANGGLLGDIHSFMYMVGQTKIPCTVSFELPADWQIATGLEETSTKNTFTANSAETLLDCPILTGHLHQWKFAVNGVAHTVAYLPAGNNKLHFDTVLLVNSIKKIVTQTARLFGRIPYKHYVFLLEDGVFGALEHASSVTIGAPDTLLTANMQEIYGEVAHEFSHTWNLVRIKPAEYTGLNYGRQERAAGLWFSEGLAMFYADLVLRRAGLPTGEKTRTDHLKSLITRYYADTGSMVISPGKVSLASNAGPGSLGDYTASVHLQGELIGALLDILIRKSTAGLRSFDDVMRLMFKRFGGNRGFYTKDVEQAIMDICNDHSVHTFFKNHLYEGKTLDFNKYLNLIGLQVQVSYQAARDEKGLPAADGRVYIWRPQEDTVYHIILTTPGSCWAKAGLHTGDAIISMNNQPIKTRPDFYNFLQKLRINDTVMVKVKRRDGTQILSVPISGYQIPVIQIIKVNNPGKSTKILYEEWEKGS